MIQFIREVGEEFPLLSSLLSNPQSVFNDLAKKIEANNRKVGSLTELHQTQAEDKISQVK